MIVVWLVCILWCVYTLYLRRRREGLQHKLPPSYPGALPFIGHSHLLLLWSKDIYRCIENLANFCLENGGVTYGYFAGEIYYGVADPEDAVTVCNAVTQKHKLYKFGKSLLGEGLLTGSGAQYNHHRKLLMSAFSSTVINGFSGIFNNGSRQLVELMDNYAGKGAFDPQMLFRNQTLRTTCITVFGDNDDKDTQFLNTYIKTIDSLLDIMMERLEKVWLHNDYIFSWSQLKKEQDRLVKVLDDISFEVIQRKRTDFLNSSHLGNLLQSESVQKYFIDILIELAANGELNDDELRDELNTAVVASFESTAQQLLMTTVFIGTYPEIQEKLYQEIMEVVGHRDVERKDVNRLVYLSAVIKESLRLVPPVILLARYVDKDVKLKNYTLRAGTQVLCMPMGIHKNKNFWGPDSEEFKPERWLEKDMQRKLDAINFSFSVGKRSCLGKNYGMTAIAVTLVYLIRNFTIKADHTKMKFKVDIITKAASGHEIILERRNYLCEYDENRNIKSYPECETKPLYAQP